MISTITTVLVGYMVALSPLSRYFRFGPLPLSALLTVITIVLVYLVVTEVVKRQFFRRVDL